MAILIKMLSAKSFSSVLSVATISFDFITRGIDDFLTDIIDQHHIGR